VRRIVGDGVSEEFDELLIQHAHLTRHQQPPQRRARSSAQWSLYLSAGETAVLLKNPCQAPFLYLPKAQHQREDRNP
jgi:hypothetical protein